MATTDAHICASCGELANKRCMGCRNGVDVNGVPSTPYYCGKGCQQAHWAEHKSVCKPSNYRDKLYKTGKLVQDLFFETREVCFDLPIGRVEETNGQLRIYERPSQPHEANLVRFASEFFKSVEDKQSMLSIGSCSEAIVEAHKIVKEALKDSYKKICEVGFQPARKHRAVFIQLDGKTPLWGQHMHFVIKISLKDGNDYALDLAGAQYGCHRAVTPWTSYTQTMKISNVTNNAIGTAAWQNAINVKQIMKKGTKDHSTFELDKNYVNELVQYWLYACVDFEVTSWFSKNQTLQHLLQSETEAFDEGCKTFIKHISMECQEFGKWLIEENGVAKLMARIGRMTRTGHDPQTHDLKTLKMFDKLRFSAECIDGIDMASLPNNDMTAIEQLTMLQKLQANASKVYVL